MEEGDRYRLGPFLYVSPNLVAIGPSVRGLAQDLGKLDDLVENGLGRDQRFGLSLYGYAG